MEYSPERDQRTQVHGRRHHLLDGYGLRDQLLARYAAAGFTTSVLDAFGLLAGTHGDADVIAPALHFSSFPF